MKVYPFKNLKEKLIELSTSPPFLSIGCNARACRIGYIVSIQIDIGKKQVLCLQKNENIKNESFYLGALFTLGLNRE